MESIVRLIVRLLAVQVKYMEMIRSEVVPVTMSLTEVVKLMSRLTKECREKLGSDPEFQTLKLRFSDARKDPAGLKNASEDLNKAFTELEEELGMKSKESKDEPKEYKDESIYAEA